MLVGSLVLSGCTVSNSPGGQDAVSNQDNNFSYSTNAGMTTKTENFEWTNSGSKAAVHWSMNMGMGSASLTVKDAAGKQVFTKSFSGTGQQASSQTTTTGEAGEWTITVKLTGASGQIAFHVNTA